MATKYKLRTTGQFKQDLKRCKKRGLPLNDLWAVVAKLLDGEKLPESHDDELVLVLIDTGSHSELFDKKYNK